MVGGGLEIQPLSASPEGEVAGMERGPQRKLAPPFLHS